MQKNIRWQALAMIALGAALGYLAANGGPGASEVARADVAVKQDAQSEAQPPSADGQTTAACCSRCDRCGYRA